VLEPGRRWRFPADPKHGRWGGPIPVEVAGRGDDPEERFAALCYRYQLEQRGVFTAATRERVRKNAARSLGVALAS
jgi:hypothetical protein